MWNSPNMLACLEQGDAVLNAVNTHKYITNCVSLITTWDRPAGIIQIGKQLSVRSFFATCRIYKSLPASCRIRLSAIHYRPPCLRGDYQTTRLRSVAKAEQLLTTKPAPDKAQPSLNRGVHHRMLTVYARLQSQILFASTPLSLRCTMLSSMFPNAARVTSAFPCMWMAAAICLL